MKDANTRPSAAAATSMDWIPVLSADRAACWGAFLYEGLMASDSGERRASRVLQTRGDDGVELVHEVCAYAPLLQAQVCAATPRPAEAGARFEYEVVFALGLRLGDYLLTNNGRLPEPAAVEAMCRELVLAFFVSPRGDG